MFVQHLPVTGPGLRERLQYVEYIIVSNWETKGEERKGSTDRRRGREAKDKKKWKAVDRKGGGK